MQTIYLLKLEYFGSTTLYVKKTVRKWQNNEKNRDIKREQKREKISGKTVKCSALQKSIDKQ